MNKTIILLIAAAGLLLLPGCLQEPAGDGGGLPMQVNPSVAEATKASLTTESLKDFYLRVVSDDPACSYFVHMSKDGNGGWESPTQLLWKNADASVDYTAAHFGSYLFKAADFASQVELTLPADQSTQERLNAADLLTAPTASKAYSATEDGALPVAFSHALAKVRFTLTLGPDFFNNNYSRGGNPVKDFTVKGVNGGFFFTPSTGEVSAGDAPVDIAPLAGTFTPGTASAKSATATYEAILVPQAYAAGTLKVAFSVGDMEYLWTNATALNLAENCTYELPLSVTTAPPEVDGEPIVFADADLEQFLLDNPQVNLNGDNMITKAEASVVGSLKDIFGDALKNGASCTSFNEFQYFTGITEIPDGSFNNWTQLESIKFPDSITTIKGGSNGSKGIFQNCPKLKSITGKYTQNNAVVYNKQLLRVAPAVVYDGQFIPDGVEIIGNMAVRHSSTTDLFIPSSVKIIRDKAFEYSAITKARFAMTTDDPETGTAYVTSLSETAFNHCFKVEKFIGPTSNGSLRVTPDNLGLCRDTTLYAYALGATATKFVIPESLGVKRIASGVFDMTDEEGDPLPVDQYKLEVIALPADINRIGTRTFYNHGKLQKLYFHGSAVPENVGEQALANVNSGMWIYVPSGASVDDFISRLNYNQVTTWETWDP